MWRLHGEWCDLSSASLTCVICGCEEHHWVSIFMYSGTLTTTKHTEVKQSWRKNMLWRVFWFLLLHSKIFPKLSSSKQQFISHGCRGWLRSAVRLFLGISCSCPQMVAGAVLIWRFHSAEHKMVHQHGCQHGCCLPVGAQLDFELESLHVVSLQYSGYVSRRREKKCEFQDIWREATWFFMTHCWNSQNISSTTFTGQSKLLKT